MSRDRLVTLAGTLLWTGAAWSLLSILVAESLTPSYDVAKEAISGLGSPIFSGICNTVPSCVAPMQPASAIFVFSLFLTGVFGLWSGYLLRRSTIHRLFGLAIAVEGVATLFIGVSYLPFYLGGSTEAIVVTALALHVAGALTVFILGPLVAVSSSRFTWPPFRCSALVLGVIALAACSLLLTGHDLGLGNGGMERMIVYPMDVWQVGFGVYLQGGLERNSDSSEKSSNHSRFLSLPLRVSMADLTTGSLITSRQSGTWGDFGSPSSHLVLETDLIDRQLFWFLGVTDKMTFQRATSFQHKVSGGESSSSSS